MARSGRPSSIDEAVERDLRPLAPAEWLRVIDALPERRRLALLGDLKPAAAQRLLWALDKEPSYATTDH